MLMGCRRLLPYTPVLLSEKKFKKNLFKSQPSEKIPGGLVLFF